MRLVLARDVAWTGDLRLAADATAEGDEVFVKLTVDIPKAEMTEEMRDRLQLALESLCA
eukprot:CAMPEP_0113722616 /NCGR_PEP_ID=MMETSP0038_2-20120614/37865_1 /TAXON_ID=2898 /ORGANISM="Cryptomonas paramecium" /LENGTH=58 /DNA_ID=CAMNT_0000651911 /DNA_START=3 /DNA_END=175 /DNA_ORIENTATION=+ /assembly_acc=CAM_ASM_000170